MVESVTYKFSLLAVSLCSLSLLGWMLNTFLIAASLQEMLPNLLNLVCLEITEPFSRFVQRCVP